MTDFKDVASLVFTIITVTTRVLQSLQKNEDQSVREPHFLVCLGDIALNDEPNEE